MERLYEGKAKIIYGTGDPGTVLVRFKDDATALDGEKRGVIGGKGYCNARISASAFRYLERAGIPTHFLELKPTGEMLVRQVSILPVEVVVRNIATGSLTRRLGIEEGTSLPSALVEHFYKNDDLHDPLICRQHIMLLGLATEEQMTTVDAMAVEVNRHLVEFFGACDLVLVDFKLEFGLEPGGRVILADEISPDTCRLWDRESGTRLDKDRFRRDLGDVEQAYREVLRRVETAHR